MRTIGEILERKERRDVVSVDVDASVREAVRRMDEANLGSVVVLDGNRLAGIFTERDLMRRVVLSGCDVDGTKVRDVMTAELVYTTPEEDAAAVMSKMTQRRCRHLPVVVGDNLVGLVSSGDLMRELSDEKSVEIQFLKDFIYSG